MIFLISTRWFHSAGVFQRGGNKHHAGWERVMKRGRACKRRRVQLHPTRRASSLRPVCVCVFVRPCVSGIGCFLIDYSGMGSGSSRGLIRPTSRSAKCYLVSADSNGDHFTDTYCFRFDFCFHYSPVS